MSLLDDVSIVVTPNGYKAGTLFGVIPVPTEGAELVTNGDFATDTDWSKGTGWTISGGTANCDGSQTSGTQLTQTGLTFTNTKTYKVTYTVTVSAGNIDARLQGSGATVTGISRTSSGTYTDYLISTGNTSFRMRGNDAFIGTVDNVSVKEYTSADMDVTRATAATRVDENGLVNYAEIIGGEEVTNGDFSGGSTGWTVTGSDADNYVVFDGSTARLKFLNVSPVTTLNSSFLFTSGKTYKLVVDVASVTSGGVKVDGSGVSELFNTVGINTRIIQPTGSGALGFYRATANVDLTFNSVSLKEVTRDNVPRIDYTGGGCPHILAEPMRTNLITYSEDFSQWSKEATVTLTPNYSTSPDGTNNATRVQLDADDSMWLSSLGSSKAFSIYVKGVAGETIRISNGVATMFTLTGNWDRLEVFDTSGSSTLITLNTYSSATARDIQIWGAQLEESYATSYIPTSGSTVTRNQDIFTRDGIGSLINDSEGVLFSEVYFEQTGLTNGLFAISDGTVNNILMVRYSPINKLQIESTGGVNIIESSARSSGTYKIAVKYDSNGVELWVDGNKISETSTQSTMSGINELMLGKSPYGNIVGCKVKQLQVYNTALTDAQLTSLTT